MATIDLKLKSYDELQFEIMRLITDNHLKQQQIDQLTNNWNELEEYIGKEWYCFDNESVECIVARNILDKMKEIKEKNNER